MTTFEQQPQPQQPSPVRGPGATPTLPPMDPLQAAQDYDQAAEVKRLADEAAAAGDWKRFNTIFKTQKQMSLMATMQTEMEGGDPRFETRPLASMVDAQIEIERRAMAVQENENRLENEVWQSEDVKFVHDSLKWIGDQYKARNYPDGITFPKSEKEFLEQAYQNNPFEVPPDLWAEIQAAAVRIDQSVKAVDKTASFWTHPRTRKMAQWINREAGGQLGMVVPGQFRGVPFEGEMAGQPLAQTVAKAAILGGEFFQRGLNAGAQLARGLAHNANVLSTALGAGDVFDEGANFMEGENGLVTNQHGVPDLLKIGAAGWALMTEKNVESYVQSVDGARNYEIATRNGFDTILSGMVGFAGDLAGAVPLYGAYMKIGAKISEKTLGVAMNKGAHWLAVLGGAKKPSDRALKMIQYLARGPGAAAATGLLEATMNGRHEGLAKAFNHGHMMGYAMLLPGLLGKRTEWFLNNRKNMPRWLAKDIGAAMEGAGFQALSELQLEALWQTWKNPTPSTFQDFMVSMSGMVMFKRMAGTTPGVTTAESMVGQRLEMAKNRRQLAEKGAQELMGLRKAQDEIRKAKSVSEAEKAAQKRQAIETELDVKAFGKDKTKIEREREDLMIREERVLDPLAEARKAVKGDEQLTKDLEAIEAEMKAGELSEGGKLKTMKLIDDAEAAGRPLSPEAVKRFEDMLMPKQQTVEEGRRLIEQERQKGDIDIEGNKLTFEETGPGQEQWKLRDASGKLIGGGSLTVEGGKAEIWSAEIREEHRGKGLYTRVLQEMQKRYPGGLESIEQSASAARAHEKVREMAGTPRSMEVAREMPLEPTRADIPLTRARDFTLRVEGYEGDLVRLPVRKGIKTPGISGDKAVKGLFKRHDFLARLENNRGIAEEAHEWSHALQDVATKRGSLDVQSLSPELKAELKKAAESYPGLGNLPEETQLAEGFAEFWARDILGDPNLKTDVPNLHKYMMEWIVRPENEPFRIQQKDLATIAQNFMNQGAVQRLEATRVWKGDKPTEWEKRAKQPLYKRFKTAGTKWLFDDLVVVKQKMREAFEIAGYDMAGVPLSLNPARMIDVLRMTAGAQIDRVMKMETFTPDLKRTGEGLQEIFDSMGEKGREFIQYLDALRQLDYIKRGLQTPLPEADLLYAVKQLETPEFIKGAKRLRDWATRVLDYGVMAGSITKEARDRMVAANPIWIAFQRAIEGSIYGGGRRGGTGVREAKGGAEEFGDPVEAIRESVTNVVVKAQQYQVLESAFLQGEIFEGMGRMITEVARDVQPHTVLVERLAAEVKKRGGNTAEAEKIANDMVELLGDSTDALIFFTQAAFPKGQKPVFAFKPNVSRERLESYGLDKAAQDRILAKNGKTIWLEADPDFYKALMGIDGPKRFLNDAPAFLRGLVLVPTQAVRLGATVLNPEFVVRNILKDAQTRQLYTKEGKNTAVVAHGLGVMLGTAAKRAAGYEGKEMFERAGLSSVTRVGSEISHELRMEHPNAFFRAIRWLAEWMGTPEKWARQREFDIVLRRAKKEGKSDMEAVLEAMEAAKEVSGNFTRGGLISHQISQVVPYFNPQMVGLGQFWSTVTGRRGPELQRQAITRGLINLGGMTALQLALSNWGQDDWHKDLPLWRRTHYWNFMLGDTLVNIPKPFEPGVFFSGITENLLLGLREWDRDLAEEYLLSFMADHVAGFPLLWASFAPSAEVMANYSFFRQKPIVPHWMEEGRLPKDQYTTYTTEISKLLGSVLNVSPMKVEYFLSAHTGSLALRAMRAFDTLAGFQKAAGGIGSTPVIGTLFRQTAHKQSRMVDELYDIQRQLRQDKSLTGSKVMMKSSVNQAARRMTAINEQLRAGTLTSDQANRMKFKVAKPIVERWEKIR